MIKTTEIKTQTIFLRLCSKYDADWRVRRLICILFSNDVFTKVLYEHFWNLDRTISLLEIFN